MISQALLDNAATLLAALWRWYDFENRATEETLRDWCSENVFQPVA